MRWSFTYSAQPCEVTGGISSNAILTIYATSGSGAPALAERWAITPRSASVGWDATISTAAILGGVGGVMAEPHRLGGESIAHLHIAEVQHAGQSALEDQSDRAEVARLDAEVAQPPHRQAPPLPHGPAGAQNPGRLKKPMGRAWG